MYLMMQNQCIIWITGIQLINSIQFIFAHNAGVLGVSVVPPAALKLKHMMCKSAK